MVSQTTNNERQDGRQGNGRFAKGNPGGPGRPRRSVEIEYLAAIGDIVTVDIWRAIVRKAVVDAAKGNHQAREWLTRYLVGANPLTLTRLAAMESLDDRSADEVAEHLIKRARFDQAISDVLGEIAEERNASSTSDSKARDREPERNDDLW